MISIILVNYNVSNYLFKCLDSISDSKIDKTFEIILIDNNSTEKVDIADKIDCYDISIRFFKFDNNKGFAKAVNFGIEKSRGDYVLLLNPDTQLYEATIKQMYKFLYENNDVGIVGCKVLYPDGVYQLSSKRQFPFIKYGLLRMFKIDKLFSKSKYFGQYNYTYENVNKLLSVDAVSGSCMMFKKELIDKVGKFDENFFLYFEDTDFCFRAKEYLKVVYNPECKVIHSKGESFNKSKQSINYEFFKSLRVFYNKYSKEYNNFYIIKILINCILACLVFAFSLTGNKYKYE